MPSKPDPDAAWLVEIQSAIDMINSFCAGIDRAAFVADARTSAAVAMYLLVIGEAARRLPNAVQQEAPEVPWPLIVSLRNRIAHGYSSIDRGIVWSIVEGHLPVLKSAADRMLTARGE
jgi:uncharacterized protein with HEPN domain